ncbi:hypothetical protein ACS0PU_008040 [Formica fusca]
MSLTLRTNRWASRIIIILHLVIWNAVGIILLQKGVSILRKRMLETGHIIETNSSIGLSIESITSIKSAENEYDLAIASAQQQLINRNGKIIIRIDPELSLRNDRNYPELNAIRNEFEIASEEQRSALFPSNSFENSTTDGQKLRVENHFTKINRIDDHPENKSASSKILRIARDREHIFSKILKNIHTEENITRIGSISESKEEENRDAKRKDLNSVENKPKSFTRENTGHQAMNSSLWRSNSDRIKFSNKGGAATAITMVTIGAIMLLVGPVVIILRILDERKQARKLHALSAAVREDLPPSYEQAVFSSEAPRYSSLALNDDSSLPSTPPPSPTLVFTNLVIKPHST